MSRAWLVCAALMSTACGSHAGLLLPGRILITPTCADGLPVRVLVDPACPPDGVCGFSCMPDRWRVPPVEPITLADPVE